MKNLKALTALFALSISLMACQGELQGNIKPVSTGDVEQDKALGLDEMNQEIAKAEKTINEALEILDQIGDEKGNLNFSFKDLLGGGDGGGNFLSNILGNLTGIFGRVDKDMSGARDSLDSVRERIEEQLDNFVNLGEGNSDIVSRLEDVLGQIDNVDLQFDGLLDKVSGKSDSIFGGITKLISGFSGGGFGSILPIFNLLNFKDGLGGLIGKLFG